jgi:type I restriction enzyme S subunit
MDSRIRKAIRLRNKRIKLLKEYKQALISEVVTGKREVRRTDNPQYPYELHTRPPEKMKDSGISWLGNVPEHWEMVRTKALLRERNVRGFPNEPLLAATQTKGVIRKEQYENRTVLPLKDLQNLKLVEMGDFVISLRSFQGGIEYARERGIISPAYTILYPKDTDNHAYLASLFKSRPYIENLQLFVKGIRQGQNIDYERLSRSVIPLPPLPEQTTIAEYLDNQSSKIDSSIASDKRIIELLEEYRTRLIADVVTGKVDVREVAAQLPEELPEDDAADEEMVNEETDSNLPLEVVTIPEDESDD